MIWFKFGNMINDYNVKWIRKEIWMQKVTIALNVDYRVQHCLWCFQRCQQQRYETAIHCLT